MPDVKLVPKAAPVSLRHFARPDVPMNGDSHNFRSGLTSSKQDGGFVEPEADLALSDLIQPRSDSCRRGPLTLILHRICRSHSYDHSHRRLPTEGGYERPHDYASRDCRLKHSASHDGGMLLVSGEGDARAAWSQLPANGSSELLIKQDELRLVQGRTFRLD